MVAKSANPGNGKKRRPPATTPEAREMELVALAYDAAEEMLLSPNPPAQVVTHFLKIGTVREEMERDALRKENLLREAKLQQYAEGNDAAKLLDAAMRAFTEYRGKEVVDDSAE